MNRKVYLFLVCTVAALGGFLFGFDTAVISGANPFIKKFFNLDSNNMGFVVSSMLLGCIAGTYLGGKPSDLIGRKKILMFCALLFTLSAWGSAFPDSIQEFIFFRIIGGFAVGAASMASPVYISEISPKNLRGALVSLNQFTIVLGMAISAFSNSYFVDFPSDVNWRWMLGVEMIPAILFGLLLVAVPESPRWLLLKGRKDKSLSIFKKINGEKTGNEIFEEVENNIIENKKNKVKIKELFSKNIFPIVLMGIILAILQQITGINIIIYYAPNIFIKTGMSADNAVIQTIFINLTMLIFTGIAMYTVDKFGRKPLLLGGISLMGTFLIILSVVFFKQSFEGIGVLLAIMGYIAAFSISVGPIMWVLISEIFPNRVRGMAMAIATSALWFANWLVSRTFPMLLDYFKGAESGYTFLIYAFFCLVALLYVWFKVPETKGNSLEEIEKKLVK